MSEEFSDKPLEAENSRDIPTASEKVKEGTSTEVADQSAGEEIKAEPNLPSEEVPARSNSNFVFFGFAGVVFVLLAVVVMLVITMGDVSETPAPATLSQTAQEGKQLFLQYDCNNCHPKEGRAGGTGPRLSTTGVSDDTIRNTIKRGKGGMPPRNLTDDQITKVIAYIRAIKPPPGS
jgi:mono/diheme cytochrome c family protein